MDEVDPLRKGDQDVPDPASEVEHAILGRDARRAQDAPVWSVDHPEAPPGKDIPHADPAQAAGEPLAITIANGGLIDVPGATAHLPTLPAALPPRRLRRSPPICPAVARHHRNPKN